MILIVSTDDDPHVDIVSRELTAMGTPWSRFNTEDFPEKVHLDLVLRRGEFQGTVDFPTHSVDLAEITAIWYRRPVPPRIHEDVTDPNARQVAEAESTAVLRGLWAALFDRFWMSWPMNIRRANQKFLQLRLATALGLAVPPTLITQRAERARWFHRATAGATVVKTISGVFIEGPPHRAIYTNRLTDDHMKVLDHLEVCPTQFQQYVEKAAELRITVVGLQVFAAEMQTQVNAKTAVDWRRGSPVLVPHRAVTLPQGVEQRCRQLVQRLGLTFGAIDIIKTPQDEYVFLEVNPNGQWAWIEGLTGLPIARAIATELAHPSQVPVNF